MDITRSISTLEGSFSPDSNSFRTTENSDARCSAETVLWIIRSASRSMAQVRLVSVAAKVSK